MRRQQMSIDQYIATLGRRLEMPAGERDATLLEIRSHLEERTAAYVAEGMDEAAAQRRAVETFGDARRLGRRLSAGHQVRWGWGRRTRGVVTGAVLTWALWIVGTLPAMSYYFTVYPVTSVPSRPAPTLLESAVHAVVLASPLTGQAFSAYLLLGWLWLLPLLALYAVMPFRWGRRVSRWWEPGLAYGLGTWLSVPWFAFFFVRFDSAWDFEAEARVVLLALPLALAASLAGRLWHQWRGQQPALATKALA